MGLISRAYLSDTDLAQVVDLLRVVPPTTRHLVDFPWRFSVPLGDPAADARVWMVGELLVGFAAWQAWWTTLDLYIRPGTTAQAVEAAIFDWAAGRFRELDAERGQPMPYWVEAREDDAEHLALLARHGYTQNNDYTYVMMRRSLAEPLPRPELPPGFTIRPFAGMSEVGTYAIVHNRAFAGTYMTPARRASALGMPQHTPELDLVIVGPHGQLAGFCIGWTDPARRVAQIEPFGIAPEFQRHGLGRALLWEILARFKSCGMEHAQVETNSDRAPARSAYEFVGLLPVYQSVRKGQWFSPHDRAPDEGA